MNGLYSHPSEFEFASTERGSADPDGAHSSAGSIRAAGTLQPLGLAQASHSAAAIPAIAGTTRILSSVALIACSGIVPFRLAIPPPACRWRAVRAQVRPNLRGRPGGVSPPCLVRRACLNRG